MVRSMLRQVGAIALVAFILWTGGLLMSPVAQALVQLRLSELGYHECPIKAGEGRLTNAGDASKANCYIITGTVENPTQQTIYNADIYGRIYDANHNPVMENRGRLGAIDVVEPGVSPFELRISVPANMPAPLALEQFKAAGFKGKVRR